MGKKKRNKRREKRSEDLLDLAPPVDWHEVGCGEYPVFTTPRDGGKPTLHWFETEAEACEYYRHYLREEFGMELATGAP